MVQYGMVEHLKFLKDSGASPETVKQAREGFKRAWSDRYAGVWDEKVDFSTVKDSQLFTPEELKVFTGGPKDIKKIIERAYAQGGLYWTARNMEEAVKSAVGAGLSTEDQYEEAWGAFHEPVDSKQRALLGGARKGTGKTAAQHLADRQSAPATGLGAVGENFRGGGGP